MWNRFWNSFTPADHTESESVVSDSHAPSVMMNHNLSSGPSSPPTNPLASPYSPLASFPEITPNESASVTNDEVKSNISSHDHYNRQQVEDGMFSFKFKSLSGKVHRFQADITSFGTLREIVKSKVYPEHLSLSQTFHHGSDGEFDSAAVSDTGEDDWLTISYQDDEDDKVLMTSDGDLYDSVTLAKKQGLDRVMLFVSDSSIPQQQLFEPHSALPMQLFEEITVPAVQTDKVLDSVREEEPQEEDARRLKRSSTQGSRHDSEPEKREIDKVGGIPTELLLPAAIVFLGVVIVGVFAVSRMGGSGAPRGRY